ncbi:MAG: hypothetical protein WBB25_12250 [Sulfitobacter sp.]
MKFLVHIGVNKTGTSSLQRAFFERRDKVSEQGIYYPEVGIQTCAHHPISRAIKGATLASQGMPDDWQDQIRAGFGDHELCVLSSENFATVDNPAPLAGLCPPGQTKVVIYLRDYAQYMVSWYQQALHSRNIAMSLEDFLLGHRVNFARIIANWAAVYGRDNVIVRKYERKLLKDQDIVADFCEFVRPGLERAFDGMEHNSNPSLSGNLLFFKRILNPFISHQESLTVASEFAGLTMLDKTFRGKLEVPAETVAKIRHLSREDAQLVRQDTGFDLMPKVADIAGSPSPDMSRLEEDLARIIEVSKRKDFTLLSYLERMKPLSMLLQG